MADTREKIKDKIDKRGRQGQRNLTDKGRG